MHLLAQLILCRPPKEKSARVATVSQVVTTHGDSSDEEEEDGTEEPDVDDAEILESVPDDAEVSYKPLSISSRRTNDR